ncbi:hypothetical protein ACFW9M_34475 [Streptomyces lydicus]|uniref:hypothetical protein n=1 Tax=Streptomyces lydicus TaxID=47763 RepID=UPI0036CEDC96
MTVTQRVRTLIVSDGAPQSVRVVLVSTEDSYPEELEAYTLDLRKRLLELDVDDVVLASSPADVQGAKPGDVIAAGALVVTALPFVLSKVVRLVEKWIEHRPVRTAFLTIGEDILDLNALSSADQRRVIDGWLARQAGHRSAAAVPHMSEPVQDPGGAGGE